MCLSSVSFSERKVCPIVLLLKARFDRQNLDEFNFFRFGFIFFFSARSIGQGRPGLQQGFSTLGVLTSTQMRQQQRWQGLLSPSKNEKALFSGRPAVSYAFLCFMLFRNTICISELVAAALLLPQMTPPPTDPHDLVVSGSVSR